jgi:hypothetical protein
MLISAPSERAKGMLSVIDLHVASTSTPNYQLFTGTASTHAGGGERSPLGVLEDNGTDLLFEHYNLAGTPAMAHVFAILPGGSETL